MHAPTLLTTALLALAATALPTQSSDSTLHPRANDANTFNINVWNNCPFPKQIAMYQIALGQMVQRSTPTNLASKKMLQIKARYRDTGMRISGHAEWGIARQWEVQALFEFGFSAFAGREGTAYDLSVMEGSDGDIGIGAYPIRNGRGSGNCASKTCFPWHCPAKQGWTSPGQVDIGSPADTVCYQGKTDFKLVFCP